MGVEKSGFGKNDVKVRHMTVSLTLVTISRVIEFSIENQ